MANRTFKVADDCAGCSRTNECRITGIPRDEVYQNLGNAKLYAFIDCADAGSYAAPGFMIVKEEL